MRLRRVLLSAAVLLLPLPPSASADPLPRPGWIALSTRNFHVLGDVGQRDLREVARRLEQFREALGVMFPKAILSTSTPTTVLVFKSQKSYDPVKPLYNGKINEQIAGYFQPGRSMNYVTFTTAAGIDQLDIIYHEYVHLIVNNNLDSPPVWFNEGLAEYYRTFVITSNGKQATLGRVDADHVYLLRAHFLPVADLVKVDHASPLYNESARSSIFYAESWALVHYLLLGNQQKYAPHASQFVAALAHGASLDQACRTELGTTGESLQKELTTYVQHEMFAVQTVRFTEGIGKIDDLPVSPVSEAEVHEMLGEVLFNMQRTADAKSELDRAVALDATFAPAHTALGVLAVRGNDWDRARKELELAVSASSATYISHYEYAYALIHAPEGGGPDAGTIIEKALRKAIELNPSFPDAYALLAWQFGRTEGQADEGIQLIAKAIELAPGREEYPLTAAGLLSKKQEFARSKALLNQIIRNATDQNVRVQAEQMLSSITDFEQRKAAFEATQAARAASGGPQPAVTETPVGESRFIPALRETKPGELRTFGRLTAIDCFHGTVTLVVRSSDGATIHAKAAKFSDIDFISYRSDLRGNVQCGARTPVDPVLITLRPDAGSQTSGTAVAVEFVPLDFTP